MKIRRHIEAEHLNMRYECQLCPNVINLSDSASYKMLKKIITHLQREIDNQATNISIKTNKIRSFSIVVSKFRIQVKFLEILNEFDLQSLNIS